MAMPDFNGINYIFAQALLSGLVLGNEAINCDYLDTSRRDRISYLQCHENGCCGEFEDRHCCTGPIVTVAIVFGVIFGTLFIVVVVGVCYAKFKNKLKKQGQVVPTIVADADVPRPSPLIRAPPVYNTSRLHPPAFRPQPFGTHNTFDHEVHPPPSNLHPPRLHTMRLKK